jgi:CRISPR type III-A-associated RAMP protein Csm5
VIAPGGPGDPQRQERATADRVSFTLKLTALTPFTAGSGRTLNRFDYTLTVNPRSGAPLIRLIDTQRFIDEANLPPEKKVEVIEKRVNATLDRYSRAVLSCNFRRAQEGMELVEFHRDSRDRPLVPASALRGMLRTAVLFALLSPNRDAVREGVAAAMEGRWRREGAARTLERRALGPSRELETFRALRIGEPKPLSNEDLRAYEVGVMTLAGGPPRTKTTLYLEALNPKAGEAVEFACAVDRALLQPVRDPALRGAERILAGKESLLAALRAFSQALVEAEQKFYAQSGSRELGRLLSDALRRAEGRIALPFGFGAGWRSKTVGLCLGPVELNRLAPLLSPGRSYYRRGPDPVFPKTRRWILDAGRPAEPLGWVAVE